MKIWRKIVPFFFSLACVLGLSVPAFAGSISYIPIPETVDYLHPVEDTLGSYYVNLDLSLSSNPAWNDKFIEAVGMAEENSDYVPIYAFDKTYRNLIFTLSPRSAIQILGDSISCARGGYYFLLYADPSGVLRIENHHMQGSYSIGGNGSVFILDNISSFANSSTFRYSVKILEDVKEFQIRYGDSTSKEYTLMVLYQYKDGQQAAPPITQNLEVGSLYNIPSPIIDGYTVDNPVVSGTMPESDLTITVTYSPDVLPKPVNHTLTIQYQFENGQQAASPITQNLEAGSPYNIPSPTILGYTADKLVVSGIMPEKDVILYVLYRKDSSGSSKPSGWFDTAPDVEWKDPFKWFDASPDVEWKNPFEWFDAAPDVEWWSPFPWG